MNQLWVWSTALQMTSLLMIAVFFAVLARSVRLAEVRIWVWAWLCNLGALVVTVAYWYFQHPMAALIRDSINDAGPRPITPFYGDVSVSVQRTWHPSVDVTAPQTPESTDTYMGEVLAGERLL